MPRNPEHRFIQQAVAQLAALLGSPATPVMAPEAGMWDALLEGRSGTFALEWKSMGDALRVGNAVRQVTERQESQRRKVIPVLAVPFMGALGRRLCEQASLSWIDLSGNASIDAPGIRIRILGNPNRSRHATKPSNIFASRNSRLVRALLMDPTRARSQVELVADSGLDKGRVSKLVRQMVDEGYVIQAGNGYACRDPGILLDGWREAYDFRRHGIVRGTVSARSSDEIVRQVAKALGRAKVRYALTGLAGAWALTHHAMFRVVTVLLPEPLPRTVVDDLGLLEEPRGANVWLVAAHDDAVFQGMRTQDGFACAHPLQVYLDLKAHPERAEEAAAEVRRRYLDWK